MNRLLSGGLAACLLAALPTARPGAPAGDLVETARRAGSFGTLLAAVEAADLVEALRGPGPFTVLAPTDEAFAKLPAAELERLLLPENRAQLAAILKHHVIPTGLNAAAALGASEATTLQGDAVSFSLRDGRLFVDDARVLLNDVPAENGVIHAIDTVLLPAELPARGRLVIGVYLDDVSASLAAQLGLDRKSTLLVERLTEDGNARRAGVERYDVIVSIDGKPATSDNLAAAKRERGPGGIVDLEVVRRGAHVRVHVPVGVVTH